MNGTRVGFLGAVPLSPPGGFGYRAARKLPAAFIGNGPSRSRSVRIGQFTWPGTGAVTSTTGTVENRCYKCGISPPRLMTPGTAALSPAGCQEVAMTECSPVTPTEGVQGHWTDGPTRIQVTALSPEELKPYPGAEVVISAYSMKSFDPASGSLTLVEIARGKTGGDGVYVWKGSAPGSPNKDYRFRVAVSGGRPKTTDVLARTASATASANQALSEAYVVSIICSGSSDPLVCAVAEAQVGWSSIYEQQLQAMNYYTTGRPPQVAGLAADTAHANVPLNHPKLKEHWDTFSWWVGDVGIPPKDWPALVSRFEQTWRIFSGIPFPRYPGLQDTFANCAKGIPIGVGRKGENYSIVNPRLYSNTWSTYFPRSDKRVEQDMAIFYWIGFASIFECVIHKIQSKIRETQRTLRSMAVISIGIVVIFSPFLVGAGVGGVAVLATEVYEDIVLLRQGKEDIARGITAAMAIALLGAQDPSFVAAALEPIVKSLVADMDPTLAKIVIAIYPKIINFAVSAVTGSATTANAAGAGTTLSYATIASAVIALAIKLLAAIPKLYAAEKIKELGDVAAGAAASANDILLAVSGGEVSPALKPFLEWVVTKTILDAWNAAVDQGLDDLANALGIGQVQGGGIATVPESGGGVTLAPTNADGVPTDSGGTPLPGGVAPQTPLTIPTATSEIGALAGIGGATAALLLITGALRF